MRKIVLIALLLTLIISGAAFAQSTPPVFCGDLSDADCAILTKAQDAMKTLDSATFTLDGSFVMTNVPNMPNGITVTLSGNGSYSGVSALKGMDQTKFMTDPGSALVTLLDNFNGDLSLTINLPKDLMAAADPKAPSTIDLQVRLVNGIGYVNFDKLQPLINDPSYTGWGGLDLSNLLKAAMKQMPTMFDSMTAAINSGSNANTMSMIQEFQNPDMLSKFMKISRTDDGSGDTATFDMTFDFSALMTTPGFQDLLKQSMQAQSPTMTDAQMGQAIAMVSQMYKGIEMHVVEEIGVSDGFTHSVKLTMAFDTTGMMNAVNSTSGSTSTTPAMPAPMVNFDFTVNYDNFNSAPAITAPDNVSMLPYQALLSMAGSASGGSNMAPMVTPEPTTSG